MRAIILRKPLGAPSFHLAGLGSLGGALRRLPARCRRSQSLTRHSPPPSPPSCGITSNFPSCRPHYLPALTAAELASLPNKHRALVIIPAGAIEQHGPHLPVGVDAILAQAWLASVLPKLSARAAKRVFVAPPITFGKSNEHDGFPGTVTISARTLRRVLLALAAELRAMGFRNIAVLNTHGGNSPVIVHTLREIQTTLGMRAAMLRPEVGLAKALYVAHSPPDFTPPSGAGDARSACPFGAALQNALEVKNDIHAGEWETSLMLACAPGLVRMDKAVCENTAVLEKMEEAGARQAWMTRDISESGVMGDARLATADKGKFWMEVASSDMAGRIEVLLR